MTKVAAYTLVGNHHAQRTVPLLAAGATLCGDQVDNYIDAQYIPDHVQQYDAAIFWGYVTTCQNIMNGFRDAGKAAVYLDLAYWQRDHYFKVSVNDRHPTQYFQKRNHDSRRRVMVSPELGDWKCGNHILLAGMGAKAAWAEKCEPVESWERTMVQIIKDYTNRPIIYRPKPSWSGAKPIPGTIFSSRKDPLPLKGCHAVVTHHSNVAVDGLVYGVPVFTHYGVASSLGSGGVWRIEKPYYSEDREQWLNDVAYCQWSETELKDGTCWRHLKEEGLVK